MYFVHPIFFVSFLIPYQVVPGEMSITDLSEWSCAFDPANDSSHARFSP